MVWPWEPNHYQVWGCQCSCLQDQEWYHHDTMSSQSYEQWSGSGYVFQEGLHAVYWKLQGKRSKVNEDTWCQKENQLDAISIGSNSMRIYHMKASYVLLILDLKFVWENIIVLYDVRALKLLLGCGVWK